MMSKNNAYFENLKRIGHDWEAARVERQARKIGRASCRERVFRAV